MLLEEFEMENFKYCPECGAKIEDNAKMCNICGSWFDLPKNTEVSNVQSTQKMVLLFIFSGSFYQVYWLYRNWRDFKAYKNLDIRVGLRTLGLFIPLVNLYFIGTQFSDIRDYVVEADLKPFSLSGVIIAWLVLLITSNLLGLFYNAYAAVASIILSFCLVIPFYMVQISLNEYWSKVHGDLPPRSGLSGGEILVLIIGFILLVLSLVGIMVMFGLIGY